MDPKAYSQLRELEDTHWWFRGRRAVYLGLLRSHLGTKRIGNTLDLGCGMGGFLPELAELSQRVFPADFDVDSMVRCRERGFPGGSIANSYNLPYADGSFDLVCMFDVLEHIPDHELAMREVQRVLAPDGLVQISVPAYQFLWSNNDRIAMHHRRYTRRSLRPVFEQAQLKVERCSHSNVFLFPAIVPALMGIKLMEKINPKQDESDQTNLSFNMPNLVGSLLFKTFAAELPFTRRFDWPMGHSIVAIARKGA
ncbi:MAG: SAM-dependent methyltransferase [Planctomycetota bacterium]|jgi:SAM-dependent methyltransferase